MMFKALSYFEFLKDLISDRYSCFVAETPEDTQRCLDIRKTIFGDELKRKLTKVKYSPADMDQYDERSVHIACLDNKTNQIVGSVRITRAMDMANSPEDVRAYRMDLFPTEMWPRMWIASRLAVLKEHRHGPAALNLARECYKYCFANDCLVSLIVCEPNFYPMYRRLGYVPLGKVTPSPFGGYRLPLYFVIHDYEHMQAVSSPFLSIAKEHDLPDHDQGILWAKNFQKTLATSELGYETLQDSEDFNSDISLFENMSEESKDQVIRNAVRIDCNFGDLVMGKDAGDKNFGIVNKGALEVSVSPERSLIIGEGEIFGEIAFLLNTPRSADIIAASDETEVILFSLSAVQKIKSQEDQAVFWRNLARILAQRVLASNITQ